MLLDTHSLLWFLNNDRKLPSSVKERIETTEFVFFSMSSIWEIALKVNIGKLTLLTSIEMMQLNLINLNIQEIPITFEDAATYTSLPINPDHRDPFDRMLVAQAIHRSLPLVSKDEDLDFYQIQRIWK